MEYIEVKNFGPIDSLKIEIRDINIFIGETSTGKSVIAKLICIFNSNEFLASGELDTFKTLLKDYNIDFEIKDKTYIKYGKNNYYWQLRKNKFTDRYPFRALNPAVNAISFIEDRKNTVGYHKDILFDFIIWDIISLLQAEKDILLHNAENKEEIKRLISEFEKLGDSEYSRTGEITSIAVKLLEKIKESLGLFEPLYIPAERILLSMIAESVFGLLENNVSIAQCVKDFGSRFETARKALKEVDIEMLQAKYSYSNKTNNITLKDGETIELEKASSGFQSLTPLYLVIAHFLNEENIIKHCVTVEEPELNLYPTLQKQLVEFLVQKTLSSGSKLILTTHSPYVLTTIDNLIQAHNTATQKPKTAAKVKKLVPTAQWLDYDKVTSYYFKEGSCVSTLDEETQSIGPSNIDDVSGEIAEVYEKLLALKYS